MSKNGDSFSEISAKVKNLKKGQSFYVSLEKHRHAALVSAKSQGKRVTTRREVGGGFSVIGL